MDTGVRLAVAATFVWLGMVLAMSLVEAPLKFRAPGTTFRIGLGIGQMVFRALNACEYVFAVVIAIALFTHETGLALNIALVFTVAALLVQSILLRPLMTRRIMGVLDGDEVQRPTAYFVYLALELIKAIALIWSGVLLIDM